MSPFPSVGGCESHAHGGITQSAEEVLSHVGDSLSILANAGFKIKITGHSLGAGVAVLLALMLKDEIPTIECYGIETPACAADLLAEAGAGFITNLITRDDVVPRFGVHTSERLRVELEESAWREKWQESVYQRLDAVAPISSVVKNLEKKAEDKLGQVKGWWGGISKNLPNPFGGREELQETKLELGRGDCVVLSKEEAAEKSSLEELQRIEIEEERENRRDSEVMREERTEATLGIELFIPGKCIHIFRGDSGVSKAVWMPRDHPILRKMITSESMVEDHLLDPLDRALETILMAPKAQYKPPHWVPWDWTKECCRCHSNLTTSTGRRRKLRNCSWCGCVTCKDCVMPEKRPIPEYGIMTHEFICTHCDKFVTKVGVRSHATSYLGRSGAPPVVPQN